MNKGKKRGRDYAQTSERAALLPNSLDMRTERGPGCYQSRPSPLLASVVGAPRSFLALLLSASQQVVRGSPYRVRDPAYRIRDPAYRIRDSAYRSR